MLRILQSVVTSNIPAHAMAREYKLGHRYSLNGVQVGNVGVELAC